MPEVKDIFEDAALVKKIQDKLPTLFHIAELESARAGKIGMEVGSLREKIIIALLIYKFGSKEVDTNLPITEPEADVKLGDKKISIKTITNNGGVKAVWTVDAKSAKRFVDNYAPQCDIILVNIHWGTREGGLYLIPLNVQQETFKRLGRVGYLKMPKAGTNPRGVEFSKEAIGQMLSHKITLRIAIIWRKGVSDYNTYKRWVDYWAE